MIRVPLLAAVLTLIAGGQGALAQTTTVAPVSAEKKADPEKTEAEGDSSSTSLLSSPTGDAGGTGFSLAYSYYQQISNGAFVRNAYARNTNWSNYLLLQPNYRFSADLGLQLRTTWNYEFTRPDAENGRRFAPDDWVLVANYTLLREKTSGFGLIVGPRATLPISLESRGAGRYTTASLAAIVTKTLADQSLSLIFGAAKTFSRYTANAVITPETANGAAWDDTSPTSGITNVAHCRAAEAVCGADGMAANASLSATFLIAGELPFGEGFSYYVLYRLGAAWNHTRPVDEFTPKVRDSAGNLVVDGSGYAGNSEYGSLGISYQATDEISVDLWTGSFQPALRYTDEGWMKRFPFWDFAGLANNLSQLGLGISGQL